MGLILAAGKGTRISSKYRNIPKPLLSVDGRPVLEYNLLLLKEAKVEKIFIVVDYKSRQLFEKFVEKLPLRDKIEFIIQRKRLGTAHAVKIAESKIGNRSFIYMVGDNFTNFNIQKLIEKHKALKADATLALKEVDKPQKYGIAEVKDCWVKRIIEKPERPPTNLSFTSMAIFEPVIFEIVKKVKKNPEKGEYFITDAIEKLIENGGKVGFLKIDTWRININTPEDLEIAKKYAKKFYIEDAPID